MPAYVLPFAKIDKDDVPIVGGKGANLGEMTQAGFPVPNGFCVTAEAYREVIKVNELDDDIKKILEGLDVHDSDELRKRAIKIKRLISRVDVPTEMAKEIMENYLKLQKDGKALVAVRSSATAEDLPDASFAGQQATFLNIRGESNLMQAVRDAWASLFEPRAIFYRETKGFDHFKVALAVPVQLMVQSEVSGIMFTINPVTNDKRVVVIESVWGLGEKIVQGAYTPDHYEVNKDNLDIRSRIVSRQTKQLVKKGLETKEVDVLRKWQEEVKLSDNQIVELAKIGIKLQQHYFFPQDVEWALEDGKLYIVQTRPITTIEETEKKKKLTADVSGMKLIAKGDAASPGVAWGEPRLIKSAKEISKVKEGDVLVTEMTTPDFVPAMKRAVAIVTNKGGQTSHAAIVSRELGLPAVVGTGDGTSKLKGLKKITVNGTTGEIFAGEPAENKQKVVVRQPVSDEALKTATKVYVNLGEPELAAAVAPRNVDGVGLLRAEFMMAQIGKHPKRMIRDGKKKEFIDQLADGLQRFCSAFGYRPVVYRASDFKTNEYRNLVGGGDYEQEEANPMLGYRGALRYITDEAVFEMELEAIKRVRNKLGFNNLWMMIPFVRTPQELMKVKRIVAAAGLHRSPTFKLWMMVEIPSNVILLEEFAKAGIDGISIGSNDLTMLTLGADRDNENLAGTYDERNPAAMWMFETAIKKAHKLGLTVSMCGQAPSMYMDLTRQMVEWGITSVSVSPDAIDRVREVIYEAEKRLVKRK